MDRFTYEQLRQKREDLRLPLWLDLTNTDRHYAKGLTVEQLIARRMAKLLRRAGDGSTIDRLRIHKPYRKERWIFTPRDFRGQWQFDYTPHATQNP